MKGSKLFLFDVDGTLTHPLKPIEDQMVLLLDALRQKYTIGYVGGSNLEKHKWQLGSNVLNMFDYCFPENGLIAYRDAKLIGTTSFIKHIGETDYKHLVNFILHYIADLDIPIKRGTFVEFRNGMINVSPIGRNCSQIEREEFEQYDKMHHIRENFIKALEYKFESLKLQYVIGGQISFDVFPQGWDKRYCLNHINKEDFSEIHFFGDKTFKGGNDYELYHHPDVIGHSVKNVFETQKWIEDFL